MKISIIGGAGSGKSTLAKRIGEKLNIPYMHIDRHWFEAGGKKIKASDVNEVERVRNHIKEKVENFIKQDSWVSDGWYSKVQPIITEQADTLIFLDMPLRTRIMNHLKRMILTERHSELNKWDDIIFFYDIIRRQKTALPKMRKFAAENEVKLKVLKNYKEVDDYIKSLRISSY